VGRRDRRLAGIPDRGRRQLAGARKCRRSWRANRSQSGFSHATSKHGCRLGVRRTTGTGQNRTFFTPAPHLGADRASWRRGRGSNLSAEMLIDCSKALRDNSSIWAIDLGMLIGLLVLQRLLNLAGPGSGIVCLTTGSLLICNAMWRWHDTLTTFAFSVPNLAVFYLR